jgi:glyoxylase-like metal-dependent hydrolase (beta-lactamase superfamily II)
MMRWFDDWYVVEDVAPGVFAIGEPKYAQLNWSYLLEGDREALLFDTGPGERNIKPVVESLTRKPLTVLPSHLHYDHIGNLKHFESVAFADLPLLRSFEKNGLIEPPYDYVLGAEEGKLWKRVKASRWLSVYGTIDLGSLHAMLLHTPGHSPESVSLYIPSRNLLLAADFVYPGPLYAQVPHASLVDYLETADRIANNMPADIQILCGHGEAPDVPAPRLGHADLLDLASELSAIRNGNSTPNARDPYEFRINTRMTLLASKASFGAWQAP